MKAICSQCGKDLPSSKPQNGPGRKRKLCPECRQHLSLSPQADDPEKALEGCEFPARLLNQDVQVMACNQSFIFPISQIRHNQPGRLVGEFLGCENSHSPGGCGKSSHCGNCAIRWATMKTLKTGKPQKHVRAFINQMEGVRRMRRELFISTTKMEKMICVTVETFFVVLEPPSGS